MNFTHLGYLRKFKYSCSKFRSSNTTGAIRIRVKNLQRRRLSTCGDERTITAQTAGKYQSRYLPREEGGWRRCAPGGGHKWRQTPRRQSTRGASCEYACTACTVTNMSHVATAWTQHFWMESRVLFIQPVMSKYNYLAVRN